VSRSTSMPNTLAFPCRRASGAPWLGTRAQDAAVGVPGRCSVKDKFTVGVVTKASAQARDEQRPVGTRNHQPSFMADTHAARIADGSSGHTVPRDIRYLSTYLATTESFAITYMYATSHAHGSYTTVVQPAATAPLATRPAFATGDVRRLDCNAWHGSHVPARNEECMDEGA
jgi:hypothetical protein